MEWHHSSLEQLPGDGCQTGLGEELAGAKSEEWKVLVVSRVGEESLIALTGKVGEKSLIALTGKVVVPVAATGRMQVGLKGSDFNAMTVIRRQCLCSQLSLLRRC